MGRIHKKKLAEYVEAEGDFANKESTEVDKEKFDAYSEKTDLGDVLPNENIYEKIKRTASEKNISDVDSDDVPLNSGYLSKKPRKSMGKKTAKIVKQQKKKMYNTGAEDGEEYEVKDIVDHKLERGVSYFLIRWKGYTKDDDTWEPENTLSCPNLIEKFRKKHTFNDSSSLKKFDSKKKKRLTKQHTKESDPNKEWEVEKIIDYAVEKTGRVFRIRWKGFGSKHDTWEPEQNLYCDQIIDKFMKRMKTQENLSFKELREDPKKTRRLVNETIPREIYHSVAERKSKRSVMKKRVFYGDSDE